MNKQINNVNTPYFSRSELGVVELLARGYSEKEIADKLHLSPYTINNHMRNIRERNGLSKNTEVILLYIAYLNKKKFSLSTLKEIGLSAILVLVNICEYTKASM